MGTGLPDHVITVWDVVIALIFALPGIIAAWKSNLAAKAGQSTLDKVREVKDDVKIVHDSTNGKLDAALAKIAALEADNARLNLQAVELAKQVQPPVVATEP